MSDENTLQEPVSSNAEHAKLVEEIFDSIAIYLHLVGEDFSTTKIAISNIPFTEKDWKNKLHFIDLEPELSVAINQSDLVGISYNVHKKLLYNLAYILSIRGHEVFICFSRNPGPKNGSYTHYSSLLKERLKEEKPSGS